MTREQFKKNLIQAIEYKDQDVSDSDIEKFLDLNFDEDNYEWDYNDFTSFASKLCSNFGNFWETARNFDLHCPDKHYRVRTTSIDYYLHRSDVEEDVRSTLDEDELESMSEDALNELIEQTIEDTISELPQELEFEIDCNEIDLEDILCDWISSETGYFINDFEYVILEEN